MSPHGAAWGGMEQHEAAWSGMWRRAFFTATAAFKNTTRGVFWVPL